MVSQYSTNCSKSLHSLSSPSRTTSRNPLIGAAAAILRGMHCERPRTRLSPSCSHITPLALTTHLAPLALTTHLSHSPLTSRTHLSPLTHTYLSPSCCSFEPATCNASPPSPQHLPNPQHLPLQFSLPRSGDSRTHRAPLTSEPATLRPDSESHPDSQLSKPRALPRSRDSRTHRAPLTSEPATPRPDSESHPDSQHSKPRAGEAPRQNPAAL
jgi:hypothetical protein